MAKEPNELISVIVPIYKVEAYLEACLSSLMNQDYSNFEVILVNDGSPDGSAAICQAYTERDNRFKVFHKENGGLSDARNYGLAQAKGEWLTFVDSDDQVSTDYLSYLYQLVKETGTLLSMASLQVNYLDADLRIKKSDRRGDGSRGTMSAKEAIASLCYHEEVDTCSYAKLFHKSLLKDFSFPKGKLFEDIGTTYLLFERAGQVAYGFEPKYNYMIRQDSIVTSGFSERKYDLLDMTDFMAQQVLVWYPDLEPAVLRRQVYARFSTLNQMIGVEGVDTKRQELIAYIKQHRAALLRDPRVPRRDRLALRLLQISYPFYCQLWGLYLKRQRG